MNSSSLTPNVAVSANPFRCWRFGLYQTAMAFYASGTNLPLPKHCWLLATLRSTPFGLFRRAERHRAPALPFPSVQMDPLSLPFSGPSALSPRQTRSENHRSNGFIPRWPSWPIACNMLRLLPFGPTTPLCWRRARMPACAKPRRRRSRGWSASARSAFA